MAESIAPSDGQLADLADAILEIARRLTLRAQELREIGSLTGTEVIVLRVLRRSTHISPSQIAVATGLKRSNVSAAIRSLQGRGLLERGPRAEDERSVELVATSLAVENLETVRLLWASRLREVPADLLERTLSAESALQELADYLSANLPSSPAR